MRSVLRLGGVGGVAQRRVLELVRRLLGAGQRGGRAQRGLLRLERAVLTLVRRLLGVGLRLGRRVLLLVTLDVPPQLLRLRGRLGGHAQRALHHRLELLQPRVHGRHLRRRGAELRAPRGVLLLVREDLRASPQPPHEQLLVLRQRRPGAVVEDEHGQGDEADAVRAHGAQRGAAPAATARPRHFRRLMRLSQKRMRAEHFAQTRSFGGQRLRALALLPR